MASRVGSLDALRGALALYVVLHHVSFLFSDHWSRCGLFLYNKVFALGHEAVVGFFILSGFAIMRSHAGYDARLPALGDYAYRRVKRLYGVYAGALLLTWLLSRHRSGDALALLQLPANVMMLQAGSAASWLQPFMGNTPLWSLSYEAAYYSLFPVLMWVGVHWGRMWLVAAVGALTMAGWVGAWQAIGSAADILGLLPIWWLGAWLAKDACPARRWKMPMGLVCFGLGLIPLVSRSVPGMILRDILVAAAFLPLFVRLIREDGNVTAGGFPFGLLALLGFIYGLGAWFLVVHPLPGTEGGRMFAIAYLLIPLLAVPVGPILSRVLLNQAVVRFLMWSCGISYGVYVIHFPILEVLRDLWQFLAIPSAWVLPVGALGFGLSLGLGWFLESPIHRQWCRWLDRLLGKRPRIPAA
jgi:peptidoglycan/LPS O-acetylase OafA/YrhL